MKAESIVLENITIPGSIITMPSIGNGKGSDMNPGLWLFDGGSTIAFDDNDAITFYN